MATLFGNIMTIEDVPGTIARWMLSITESKIIILLLINVLLLIVGVFMEALAAIVILTPILLPVVTGVGVSPPALRHHHGGQPGNRLPDPAGGRQPLRGVGRGPGQDRKDRRGRAAHDRPDAHRPGIITYCPSVPLMLVH